MKLLAGILLITFTSLFIHPFPENDVFSASFKAGNAKELAKHFGSNVELNLPGSEGVYSRAQAEQILRDFFSKNPPKNYQSLHNGTSKDSHYAIGSLTTAKSTYRTYVLYKKDGAQLNIQELRIELDE